MGGGDKKLPLLIAGNGPSLACIDSRRLPVDFDVYRCNQFYFEEKYYTGRKIKAVFFNPGVFFEQYYTLGQIQRRKEYEVDEIYCSQVRWGSERLGFGCEGFSDLYPDATEVYKLLYQYPKIVAYLKYNDLYLQERITSGVLMLLVAAINQYREIYIAGIDFYEGEPYAFEHQKDGILDVVPEFAQVAKHTLHTRDVDIETMKLVQKEFGLKIYSVCESSPLSEIFSLAEPRNNRKETEIKPRGSITDLLIPDVKNPLDITLQNATRDVLVTQAFLRRLKRRIKRLFERKKRNKIYPFKDDLNMPKTRIF